MDRFLLGVNYWPRSSAMAMWSRFDLGEIGEDFARIKALGLDVVSFFLSGKRSTRPRRHRRRGVRALRVVLERAHACGLKTMSALFCGDMSGVNWLPAWALDRSSRTARFRTISAGKSSPYAVGDFYQGELLEAQRFNEALGEGIRGLELGRLLVWSPDSEAVALEPINDSQGQGVVRTDHRQSGPMLEREGEQAWEVLGSELDALDRGGIRRQAFVGHAWITRRHQISVACGDRASFQTRACSRPPDPMTRILMGAD